MKNKLYIVALEPIETRYTGHWYEFLPEQLHKNTSYEVVQIAAMSVMNESKTSEGAFLDFAMTNVWKNHQASRIAKLFSEGKVKPGDYFLFTDAWNPTAIEIKYMADLFEIPIKMGGIWHAGSYDPADFLGRKIRDKNWSYSVEKSLLRIYDQNFFATEFHRKMMGDNLTLYKENDFMSLNSKMLVVGFPMEYYSSLEGIEFTHWQDKEDLVIFPHRISPEKKPELFKMVSKYLPEYEFVVCQEENLTKEEYHSLLRRAKVVFSANEQETLGIGVYEAMMCGAVPLVPNRLSYKEMYDEQYRYDVEEENAKSLAIRIESIIEDFTDWYYSIEDNLKQTGQFFDGRRFYQMIQKTHD